MLFAATVFLVFYVANENPRLAIKSRCGSVEPVRPLTLILYSLGPPERFSSKPDPLDEIGAEEKKLDGFGPSGEEALDGLTR